MRTHPLTTGRRFLEVNGQTVTVGHFFDELTVDEDWKLAAIFDEYELGNPNLVTITYTTDNPDAPEPPSRAIYHRMMEAGLKCLDQDSLEGFFEFLNTAWGIPFQYMVSPVDKFCGWPLSRMPLYISMDQWEPMPCDPGLLVPDPKFLVRKELPCPEVPAKPLVWQGLLSRWRLLIQR